MSARNLTAGPVLEAFQQHCQWLLPSDSTTRQYVSVALNEGGWPQASQVFGDLSLSQKQIRLAEQMVGLIFAQLKARFELQPTVTYQIKLTLGKTDVIVLEHKQLTGLVTSISFGYIEVQTEKNLVAVQTAVEHTLEDTVVISFQPFPCLQGEEYLIASATGSLPVYELLDFQVDVIDINVKYSETSEFYRLPILSLANCSRWNQQLSDTVRSLASRYTHWRKGRGDGNCYYRCVAISYLEYLCRNSTPLDHFAAFYMKVFKQENVIIPDQLAVHYRKFINPFQRLYIEKGRGQALICLQTCLQDPDFDLGIVAVFRCLALYALCQLKQHPDFSAFFIEGEDTCEADMGTMGKDAEGMIFHAMANALDAKIVHITLSNAALRDDSFQPQTPGQKVVLHVLFKPGSYDVLYPHAVQLQDQYEYASNSFRNPPVPVQFDTKDYIETI